MKLFGKLLFATAFTFFINTAVLAHNSLALQYTLDPVPLALATGTIVSRTTVGGVTTFKRETEYGGGVTPLGGFCNFK